MKKKGNTYWACCPFHSEKEPSFAVNEPRQIYHCFGCGEAGDSINFIKKMEHITYFEAAKLLAQQSGIDLPEQTFNEDFKKNQARKERLFKLNYETKKFYISCFNKSKLATEYLKNRGVNTDALNQFEIGFSPDGNSLVEHLKKSGFSEQEMMDAGVADKKNNRLYDVMWERIMFPIINTNNEVIGFSGRAMKDGNFAKYRNTAQTIIFDKSKAVFAINLFKEANKEAHFQNAILVEGQMDVIALHQAGIKNAVAGMGTAFTQFHAKEISRFVKEVVLCFDGDGAGIKASFRVIDILKNQNLDVKVISIPDGKDPDEFIKLFGKEKFLKLVENALPANDYKLKSVEDSCDLTTPYGITKYVNEALEVIKTFSSNNERDIYLKIVRDKSGTTLDSLKRDLNQQLDTTLQKPNFEKATFKDEGVNSKILLAETFVLASLINKKPYIIKKEFQFSTPIFNTIFESVENNENASLTTLKENFKTENEVLKNLFDFDFSQIKEEKAYYNDCLKTMEFENLNKTQQMLTDQMESATTLEEKQTLAKKMQEVMLNIRKMKLEEKF